MIEATCSACGTLNRIAEADVPAGAKFVNCTSCKSRVVLPTPTKSAIPSIPKPPSKVPAIPSIAPPPVPKGPPGVSLGQIGGPPAVPTGAAGGAGNEVGISDLPAPRRQSALGAEPSKPAPRSALASAMDDLPAPKPVGGGPPPSLDLDDLMGVDLPAPKSSGVADLPAPKARPATAPGPGPAAPPPPMQPQGVSDLPAPKARPPAVRPAPAPSSAPIDLPAPRGIADLPAPKAGGISDLPAPKPGGLSDLPMPKPGGPTDLPTPKRPAAPAAARGPDPDLLQPKSALDLPAPKGFFDDLPQPAGPSSQSRPEVPAPKGFFDDLPQPSLNRPGEDIAPKGFFEDLPGKASARPEKPEVPAPKGFFDDLPQPAHGQPEPAPIEFGGGALPLDLGDDSPIELAEQPSGADSGYGYGGGGGGAAPSPGTFDDLDLSKPSTGPSALPPDPEEENKAVIRFGGKKNAATAQAAPPENAPLPSIAKPGGDVALELEEPRQTGGMQKLQPKKVREDRAAEAAATKAARARRAKIVLGVVLGLAVAGGGGAFLYKRHAAAQEKAEQIETGLTTARKALVADDANHWGRAASAANQVIELDDSNAEALGIAAEASFAGAFADGKQREARFAKGRKLINDALAAGITGPALDRAQALSTLTTAPDKAVPKLQALAAKAPKDGTLLLYLGWAQAAAGDPTSAKKSFDAAMAATPSLKILSLDGRARSKLELADVEGARSDFNEIIAIQKDNISAQVGIASTLPQAQAQQQEADLLAILARKDIKDADPRAVVAAYVLAGDDALRSRRLDAARERFRKALGVEPKDVSAMTGLAETDLRDRKLDAANEGITKALTQAPNDVRAQLVAAEIEIQLGKIDSAAERIQRLGTRKPPLAPLEQAQLQLITGRMLEAQGKDEQAVDAYAAAAKLAGDFDLTPTMAAVAKLTAMADKALEARNPAKQAEYRQRADELLSALDSKAQTDPQLAMTLGVAYLQANNPEKAEGYLRRVVEARPSDADALYQYGKALGLLTKFPEAIENLKKARDLAPGRDEIGLELALTYERTHDDDAAGKLYDELVAKDSASIEVRAHAGKYYVRTKQIPKGGEQGNRIVAQDPEHAAGHYLKGEGLFFQQRYDDARKEFGEAVRLERDALYLDGQGRSTELVALERNDSALLDQALRSYQAATELDPLMFDPLLGSGRIYVHRREHAKALGPLLAAQQIRTDDPEVAYLLGVSYQEIGDKKELAIKWLEFSLKNAPAGDAAFRLGQLYQDESVNKPGEAQRAYSISVRLWTKEEQTSGKKVEKLTDALYYYGRMSLDRNDEATAKYAWEKWVARDGLDKRTAKYQEVVRLLGTTLKTVGPPPPEK